MPSDPSPTQNPREATLTETADRSPLAELSLACGIGSLLLGLIGGIPAIIFGVQARKRGQRNAMATAGIALGVFTTVVSCVVLLIALAGLNSVGGGAVGRDGFAADAKLRLYDFRDGNPVDDALNSSVFSAYFYVHTPGGIGNTGGLDYLSVEHRDLVSGLDPALKKSITITSTVAPDGHAMCIAASSTANPTDIRHAVVTIKDGRTTATDGPCPDSTTLS